MTPSLYCNIDLYLPCGSYFTQKTSAPLYIFCHWFATHKPPKKLTFLVIALPCFRELDIDMEHMGDFLLLLASVYPELAGNRKTLQMTVHGLCIRNEEIMISAHDKCGGKIRRHILYGVKTFPHVFCQFFFVNIFKEILINSCVNAVFGIINTAVKCHGSYLHIRGLKDKQL